MNRILLIWDMDSSLKVYLLNVDDIEVYERIKRCHEKYINSNENDALLWLCEWLPGKSSEIIFESGEENKVDLPIVPEATLVVCGFAE